MAPPSALPSSGPPSLPCQEPRAVPRKGLFGKERGNCARSFSSFFPLTLRHLVGAVPKAARLSHPIPISYPQSTSGVETLSPLSKFPTHTHLSLLTLLAKNSPKLPACQTLPSSVLLPSPHPNSLCHNAPLLHFLHLPHPTLCPTLSPAWHLGSTCLPLT